MADELQSITIPPPTGGWNTKDPISNMDPSYAVEMVNYFPGGGTVSLRNGYTKHIKTDSVNGYYHLAELVNNAGTHFLIGFPGDPSLPPRNVTSAGAGTVIGALTTDSPEVYTQNYRGRLFCKGYDTTADMFWTDGTNSTTAGFTGPGGNDIDLWRMASYKSRLYALQKSDASMWYGGIDAITGAMSQFDFQSLLTLGGKPWYIGPFSMTGGDVTQEYFAVISEQGEALLYSGDYPGASNWGVAGRYFLPAPVGRKAFFNWRSDILIITHEGLVSLREYIGVPAGEEYRYLTDNIASAFDAAVEEVGALSFNYISGIVYAKGQYLLLNFFSGQTATGFQFVMNTQTRAWTKFTGQQAICWALLNNDLYFGGYLDSLKGTVGKADTGYFDEDFDNAGVALSRTCTLRPAYNYLGNRTMNKQFISATPIVYESEGLSVTIGADVDFQNTTGTNNQTANASDTSYRLYQRPQDLAGTRLGKAVSLRFDETVTTKRRSIQAIDIRYKDAGTIGEDII